MGRTDTPAIRAVIVVAGEVEGIGSYSPPFGGFIEPEYADESESVNVHENFSDRNLSAMVKAGHCYGVVEDVQPTRVPVVPHEELIAVTNWLHVRHVVGSESCRFERIGDVMSEM